MDDSVTLSAVNMLVTTYNHGGLGAQLGPTAITRVFVNSPAGRLNVGLAGNVKQGTRFLTLFFGSSFISGGALGEMCVKCQCAAAWRVRPTSGPRRACPALRAYALPHTHAPPPLPLPSQSHPELHPCSWRRDPRRATSLLEAGPPAS